MMKLARNKDLLLRDLMLNLQSFRQVSGKCVDGLGTVANTLLSLRVFEEGFYWALKGPRAGN